MTSWDFFDTLCGRRTGHEPWRLFDTVGGEEYRRLRQQAERASDKTWSGIFRALAEITSWPAARVAELRETEWRAELAAAFPIAENVRRVQPSDRIVSDTYFTEDQVRELADRIGIPRSVEIVASWDGKWSGRWWRTPEARSADVHVGDNPRSDHSQPRQAGLKSDLYSGCRPTKDEIAAEKDGRWEVAAAMRAARLQCPHEVGTTDHRRWLAASQANVWFLTLAVGLVRQYVDAVRPKRVLFLSRDTLLLGDAFRAAHADIETGTFWASRETLRNPSRSFAAYVRSLAKGSLFVDLHGTGKTVREFVEATGIELSYAFVCGQRSMAAAYPRLAELRGIPAGTAIEVMNYDTAGRVIDVVDGEPVRAPVEYDLDIVRVHQAATRCGIQNVVRWPTSVRPDELTKAATAIHGHLDRTLRGQHQVQHATTTGVSAVAR